MSEIRTHDLPGQESDPASLRAGTWFEQFTPLQVLLAGAVSLGLAVGITGGAVALRIMGEEASPPNPDSDRGVAVGAPFPGSSIETNTTPTPNSGGFNNAARVVLKCTGLKIERIPGNLQVFKVTPEVTVVSGEASSPYLYTLVGNDTGSNMVGQGVSPMAVERSDNAEFPVIVLADTAGTQYEANDPAQLEKPLGDSVPDSQLFECPVTAYPPN